MTRLDSLRGERYRFGPRTIERERQAGEHHKVGVERNALLPSHSQGGEAVVMLQPSELALNRGAATVEASRPTAS
jgi:hypothetical protein